MSDQRLAVAAGDGWQHLLDDLGGQARRSAEKNDNDAKRWRRRGYRLSPMAAVGSGPAAGGVAVGDLDNEAIRITVTVVSIIGAGLSGIAAAVRAPELAEGLSRESKNLEALARWADFERVRQLNNPQNVEQRIVAFYSWHDSIAGIDIPANVRNRDAPEPATPPDDP